jgi:hypothetical protein
MKHFTIGRVTLVLLATAVVCLSQAALASAGGGNSANAKLCQKGGWQTLVRSDGSTFASEEACVSYAAHGTLFQAASISPYSQFTGSFFQRVAVRGSGFTPNQTITFSESGLGPGGVVDSAGTVTSDSSGQFDSGADSLTNFWVVVAVCADGPQTIHITATDGTHIGSTTVNFACA